MEAFWRAAAGATRRTPSSEGSSLSMPLNRQALVQALLVFTHIAFAAFGIQYRRAFGDASGQLGNTSQKAAGEYPRNRSFCQVPFLRLDFLSPIDLLPSHSFDRFPQVSTEAKSFALRSRLVGSENGASSRPTPRATLTNRDWIARVPRLITMGLEGLQDRVTAVLRTRAIRV